MVGEKEGREALKKARIAREIKTVSDKKEAKKEDLQTRKRWRSGQRKN